MIFVYIEWLRHLFLVYGPSRLLTRAYDLQKNKTLLNFYIYNIWKVNNLFSPGPPCLCSKYCKRIACGAWGTLPDQNYTNLSNFENTHTHIYINICVWICIYIYIYMYMYIYIYICIIIYMYNYLYIFMCVCEYVYMGHPLFETPPYIKMNTNTHIVFVHIYIHIHVDNQKPYILFNLFLYIHIYVKIKRYIIIYIYTFSKTHMAHATEGSIYRDIW